MDRVVPVAVKAMPLEAYRRQLRIGDGDATRVLAAVEFRPNAESGPTVRRGNEAHDRGQVDEWGAAPIHRDVRGRSVLLADQQYEQLLPYSLLEATGQVVGGSYRITPRWTA